MRTIHLYGSMGEAFGPSFRLDVRSLAEAAHALGCQLPGFREALEQGRFRVTCGASRTKGLRLDKELISFGLPAGDLHIVPVVKGSGRGGGLGKIIAGTLIAAASFFVPVGGSLLLSLGAGLALSGASTLLSPKKKNQPTKRSYMFDGSDGEEVEGGCVPVIIGRCMVTGKPVSQGVTTSDSNGLI